MSVSFTFFKCVFMLTSTPAGSTRGFARDGGGETFASDANSGGRRRAERGSARRTSSRAISRRRAANETFRELSRSVRVLGIGPRVGKNAPPRRRERVARDRSDVRRRRRGSKCLSGARTHDRAVHHRPVLELDGARLVAQLLQKRTSFIVFTARRAFRKLRTSRSPPGSARASGVADRNTDGGVLRRPKVSPLVRDPRCVRRVHATREVKASTSCRGEIAATSFSIRSDRPRLRAKLKAVDAKRQHYYGALSSALYAPTSGRARGLWAGFTRSRRWRRAPRALRACRWRATPPSRRVSRLATRCGRRARADVRATGDRAPPARASATPAQPEGGRRSKSGPSSSYAETWDGKYDMETQGMWDTRGVEGPSCYVLPPLARATREDLEKVYAQAKNTYFSGQPVIEDRMFDEIERRLRQMGSDAARKYPRCSRRDMKIYGDLEADDEQMRALENVWRGFALLGTGFVAVDVVELARAFLHVSTEFRPPVLAVLGAFLLQSALNKVKALERGDVVAGPPAIARAAASACTFSCPGTKARESRAGASATSASAPCPSARTCAWTRARSGAAAPRGGSTSPPGRTTTTPRMTKARTPVGRRARKTPKTRDERRRASSRRAPFPERHVRVAPACDGRGALGRSQDVRRVAAATTCTRPRRPKLLYAPSTPPRL